MNISISNIAWDSSEETDVADFLESMDIKGIDIALSKIWIDPLAVSHDRIKEYRAWWQDHNIDIIGAQSIHFGHLEFQLFQSTQKRRHMFEYTAKMIERCGILGVHAIVFGSPKNRQRGEMSLAQAYDIAEPFFRDLGQVAVNNNTTICLEPNAKEYDCDFVNTSIEGYNIVQRVNHPGFQLHLDAGNMTMMHEDIPHAIANCIQLMQHFHISEPFMTQVGVESSPVPHIAIADTLHRLKYQQWVSIEMKNGLQRYNVDAVRQAIQFTKNIYG